jgi:Protein of unknown function (DUF4197)
MTGIVALIIATSLLCVSVARAGMLDDLEKKSREYVAQKRHGGGELDSKTIIAGLKEALSIGAKNGVKLVSRPDGYFGNQLIKILVPEKIQKIAKLMRKAGLGKEVDKFELSMNRAAEKASPQALAFFTEAIKEMTITDGVRILRGKDTEATEYLRSKTYDKIYGSFKPVVSSAMNDVGVTKSFKEMMDKARTIPFLKREAVDLDEYVTSKALDGLFVMVGQEERKIRKDPVARVTDLLKKVFKQ